MQTIIITVGTSLRTNQDRNLPPEKKRPWVGNQDKYNSKKKIIKKNDALFWMEQTDMGIISAETNTLQRINFTTKDEILLLHSDTVSGKECAEITKIYLEESHGQTQVHLHKIPGINYDTEKSSLEQMAKLLNKLIDEAKGDITLAATGGFKAQTMIMALVGNNRGIPVCYVHEDYRQLVYLPHLSPSGDISHQVRSANLPDSSIPRAEIMKIQQGKEHHRPKSWKKVEKILRKIYWIDCVHFDKSAFNAPPNGIKKSPRAKHVIWIHLYESEDTKIALSVETTAITPEQQEKAILELNERLGSVL